MARNRLVDALTGAGVTAAAELRRRLGVSPATLSRLVAEAGDTVLRMGRGRSVGYARVRTLPGFPPRISVYRVDADGDVTPAAKAPSPIRRATVGDQIGLCNDTVNGSGGGGGGGGGWFIRTLMP